MERYSAGARGQGVIPGGGTVASGSGVSSAPTTVNYTGPVLSFNSEAYVPKSAIPEIINSAARRGAQEGESKVMEVIITAACFYALGYYSYLMYNLFKFLVNT